MDSGYGKLSCEDSKSCEGIEVESVQMHGEIFDHSIHDKQAKVSAETIDDSPRSKDSNHEGRSSSDSEEQIYAISKGESDKNKHSDSHTDSTESISSSTRRRSSCSSSESSSEDFFAPDEAFKYTKSGKDNVSSNESSEKSELDNNSLIPTSTNQVYNLSHSQKGMSPTASPPMQVMDRSGKYDASIIPSSIFEPNTNPSEWSIASNDSLFSIQIGQPSLSRETALMYGELCSSMEFTKSFELNNRAPSFKIEDPTIKSVDDVEAIDTATRNVDVEKLQATTTSHESLKLEGERLSEDNNEIKASHQTTSHKSSKSNVSILSHSENGTSPVPPLKKRSRKGYGYSCSWVFFWPSCTCCCSSFSCCWSSNPANYRHQTTPMYVSYTSPISHLLFRHQVKLLVLCLTETERNDSMKMDIPRQQSEVTGDSTASRIQPKQESEVPSNSKDNNSNWFHFATTVRHIGLITWQCTHILDLRHSSLQRLGLDS
ncbi:unnamed protein product [Sphenostylis stenocarpa]|uniref:Uncharacterized protein n=1 Tax=Sphenostylis stenocarpa TaxID=92480 RepID=A0AA86S3B6_9FABA|nr:unnamed protein product [Sphenostylis stenocarpa]